MAPKKYSVNVVGESYRQAAVARTKAGERALFVHEASNSHDPRAIAVLNARREQIGFLPRGGWLTAALLDERRVCSVRILAVHPKAVGQPYAAVVLEVTLHS